MGCVGNNASWKFFLSCEVLLMFLGNEDLFSPNSTRQHVSARQVSWVSFVARLREKLNVQDVQFRIFQDHVPFPSPPIYIYIYGSIYALTGWCRQDGFWFCWSRMSNMIDVGLKTCSTGYSSFLRAPCSRIPWVVLLSIRCLTRCSFNVKGLPWIWSRYQARVAKSCMARESLHKVWPCMLIIGISWKALVWFGY